MKSLNRLSATGFGLSVFFSIFQMTLVSGAEPSVKASTPTATVTSTATAKPITLRNAPNNAFCVGEKLTFVIKYEFVNAGSATMEVLKSGDVDGRPTYQIQSNATSSGMVDSFFKVRDFNAATIDAASLYSRNFHQNLKEGGYKVIRNTFFDYSKGTYKFNRLRKGNLTERSGVLTQPVHDVLSAFYVARTLPLKPGGTYEITVFSDEDIYPLAVKIGPKIETIKVPAGKFQCLRVEPTIKGDAIFKAKEGKMVIWMTNDEKKIPVLIRSKVFIGAFDAELLEYTPETRTVFDTSRGK